MAQSQEGQTMTIEQLEDYIQRLEYAGGLALGYAAKGDFESADEVWLKAKEDKLGSGFDKKWFTDADIEAIIGDCHGDNNSKL